MKKYKGYDLYDDSYESYDSYYSYDDLYNVGVSDSENVSYSEENNDLEYVSGSKKYIPYFFEGIPNSGEDISNSDEDDILASEEDVLNSKEEVCNFYFFLEDLLEDIINLLKEKQVLKNLNKSKANKKIAFSVYESIVFEFKPGMNGIEIKIFDANSYYEDSENYRYAFYFAW